jgi:hypothetical protein
VRATSKRWRAWVYDRTRETVSGSLISTGQGHGGLLPSRLMSLDGVRTPFGCFSRLIVFPSNLTEDETSVGTGERQCFSNMDLKIIFPSAKER